jgi:hypothetical protein
MDDGTWFAIVRATHEAAAAYPRAGLVQATQATRAEAKRAVAGLWAEGGTNLAAWITLAAELLASRPAAIGHAILLTDGRDESGDGTAIKRALRNAAGAVQCDCRGIGTDWEVAELRRIADALLGTVDIVAAPADLAADFEGMTARAMAKLSPDVAMRVWIPRGARIRFVRQVAPVIVDLTGSGVQTDERVQAFATGAWGSESREYHIAVDVPVRETGAEMLAARVEFGRGGTAAALIRARWTTDVERSMAIDPEVAHYRGQEALAETIQSGIRARNSGDEAAAEAALGVAARLLAEAGDERTLRLLEAVVDVVDAATGSVRLRRDAGDADAMALDAGSTKTIRRAEAPPVTEPAPAAA